MYTVKGIFSLGQFHTPDSYTHLKIFLQQWAARQKFAT